MLKYVSGNKTALIFLHEIYGINAFAKDCCQQYHTEGYDVFCPELYGRPITFPYTKADEAYSTFRRAAGFDTYRKINSLASVLRQTYANIVVIGFSVGATVAWRCSETSLYDGMICCYGSRIRDFLTIEPQCPTLLIFAQKDTFDVQGTAAQLCCKNNTLVKVIDGRHGFADHYSENYNYASAKVLDKLRKDFFDSCITCIPGL